MRRHGVLTANHRVIITNSVGVVDRSSNRKANYKGTSPTRWARTAQRRVRDFKILLFSSCALKADREIHIWPTFVVSLVHSGLSVDASEGDIMQVDVDDPRTARIRFFNVLVTTDHDGLGSCACRQERMIGSCEHAELVSPLA